MKFKNFNSWIEMFVSLPPRKMLVILEISKDKQQRRGVGLVKKTDWLPGF